MARLIESADKVRTGMHNYCVYSVESVPSSHMEFMADLCQLREGLMDVFSDSKAIVSCL